MTGQRKPGKNHGFAPLFQGRQFSAVLPGQLFIGFTVLADSFHAARPQFANNPTGRSENQAIIGNNRSFRNQGSRSNNAVASDLRPGKDDGVHTDETVVPHRTGMENRLVPHGDIFPDDQGRSAFDMAHGAVLNICSFPDSDRFTHIRPKDRIEPDRDPIMEGHPAYDIGGRGDKMALTLQNRFVFT
nr:hypothetical protein [uncultured Sphaerochaeta sp.]